MRNKIIKIKLLSGTVELRRAPWWYTAEIGALLVNKEDRNKGHGKELINICVNKAKESCLVNLVAAIYSDNEFSKEAFKFHGFKRITNSTVISLRTGNPVEIW